MKGGKQPEELLLLAKSDAVDERGAVCSVESCQCVGSVDVGSWRDIVVNVRKFDSAVVQKLLLVWRREFESVFVSLRSGCPSAMAESCCVRICEEHTLRRRSGLYWRRRRRRLEGLVLAGKHSGICWKA